MSQTGVTAFDSTIQTTNVWLREILERLGWQERHRAYHALRAVLHALRDRLPVDQVAALGAQLPMLIRGFYYEGWQPSKPQTKTRHLEDFLSAIEDEAGRSFAPDVQSKVKAVFATIAGKIDAHEIEKLRKVLPSELQPLLMEEFYLY